MTLLKSALLITCCSASSAFAQAYCQADMVAANGRIIASFNSDGDYREDACRDALARCQWDLSYRQSQGGGRFYARCQISNGGGRPQPYPQPGREVSCGSGNYGYETCYVGNQVRSIYLIQDYSYGQCRQGQTFGLRGGYIWVNQGCQGNFAVQF